MENEPKATLTTQRQLSGALGKATVAFGATAAFYHILYVARVFERFDIWIMPMSHQATTLLSLVVLVFLLRPVGPGKAINKLPWYDVLFILGTVVSLGYVVIFGEHVVGLRETGTVGTTEMVLSYIAVITLLEAGRRVIGLAYPALVAFFIIYLFFSNYFPGFMHGRGYSVYRVAYMLYAGTDGIFGLPLSVASTIIVIFVIFASFLQRSGAGDFFLKLSLALMGHVAGGPAKVAVVASSIVGTFTGSPSANVAGTGCVTIPLMKSIGYTPAFAGGVEAAASTGSQIMPPIMGTVAFIMAVWLDIPYFTICLAAIVPAILYYSAIFIMVHLEAVKRGLRGLPRTELPPVREALKEGWYFILPIIALIGLLGSFLVSPEMSAVYAIILVILLSMFKKETRMGPRKIIASLHNGMVGTTTPGVACGLAGGLIGALMMPGIAIKLSATLVELAGGILPILLVLVAVTCLILAMGLGTVPLYIMVVILVAPALVQMGLFPLAAHLFVFYYALLSFIIPPVAIAAYTAAGIAGSSPMRTGVEAMRLGFILPVIPFAFVYDYGLLLIGSPGQILLSVSTAALGTMAIAFAVEGYLLRQANWGQRILWLAGGILLLFPGWQADLPGLAVATIAVLWHVRRARMLVPYRTGSY